MPTVLTRKSKVCTHNVRDTFCYALFFIVCSIVRLICCTICLYSTIRCTQRSRSLLSYVSLCVTQAVVIRKRRLCKRFGNKRCKVEAYCLSFLEAALGATSFSLLIFPHFPTRLSLPIIRSVNRLPLGTRRVILSLTLSPHSLTVPTQHASRMFCIESVLPRECQPVYRSRNVRDGSIRQS